MCSFSFRIDEAYGEVDPQIFPCPISCNRSATISSSQPIWKSYAITICVPSYDCLLLSPLLEFYVIKNVLQCVLQQKNKELHYIMC
jgi:hypothetical protein